MKIVREKVYGNINHSADEYMSSVYMHVWKDVISGGTQVEWQQRFGVNANAYCDEKRGDNPRTVLVIELEKPNMFKLQVVCEIIANKFNLYWGDMTISGLYINTIKEGLTDIISKYLRELNQQLCNF